MSENLMRSGLAWLDGLLASTGTVAIVEADIYVEEFATDAYGEESATVVLESHAVACQVLPMSAEMSVRQGRDASTSMVRVVFAAKPFDPDDSRQRLIKVGTRTYRPIGCLDRGSAGARWRVDCELVTG